MTTDTKGGTVARIRAHLGKSCAAQTVAGLRRYVAGHHGCLAGLWGGRVQRDPVPPRHRWRLPRREDYNPRHLTPAIREARRVAGDPEYRRARLAELRRECRVSAAAYSPERWEAARRAESVAKTLGLPARAETRDVWAVGVSFAALSYTPTCKEAEVTETLGLSRRDRTPGSTEWDRKGRPHYTRASDTSWVLSAAVLRRGVLTYWHQAPGGERERWELAPPEGVRWDRDNNGLRLVAGPDDYHPSWSELRGPVGPLVAALRANAERRRQVAALAAAEAADFAGVLVCLADSVRAGNCRAGSLAFAARHGLDARRHYGALELLTAAGSNGDLGRVRLAIRAAFERTRAEEAAGVCELAAHVA